MQSQSDKPRTMSIQTTIGSGALIAAGVGVGDVATLYTLGQRLGNWMTAEKGDADLLALMEEDEMNILQRRGLVEIATFQKRWDRRIRLLGNNKPRKIEGDHVEKLLRSNSQWTVMFTCITAALDEFATATTVRNILKLLLNRLFSTQDDIGAHMTEDVLNSNVRSRINGWRSAAAVREINIQCRRIRHEFLDNGLVVQGDMPASEANETADFLYWLLACNTDKYYTSSSDIAAIAHCLSFLSFESLTVENFGPPSGKETNCRLLYSQAALYSGYGHSVADARLKQREQRLSTIVSMTQPEETFSTFPISNAVSNRCRQAWELGAKAAISIVIEPTRTTHEHKGKFSSDLIITFRNIGSQTSDNRRIETDVFSIATAFAIFSSQEVATCLAHVLKDSPEKIKDISWDILHSTSAPAGFESKCSDPEVLELFTVVQAFFMGYYYKLFGQIVDISTLEVQTVNGYWGYKSPDLLVEIGEMVRTSEREFGAGDEIGDTLKLSRSRLMSLLAMMYAGINTKIPNTGLSATLGQQELCVGVIGRRTLLLNSLVNDCKTTHDLCRFIILDCDVGGIPRNTNGLVLTGVAPTFPTWGGHEVPQTHQTLTLTGPETDCTKHIEADWDLDADRMLLCVRYKGRRIGSINPVQADIAFNMASAYPQQTELTSKHLFGPAHSCSLDDVVVSGRLVVPGRQDPRMPVVVHTKNNPCLRYVLTAWYSSACDVMLVEGSLSEAFEHWRAEKVKAGAHSHKFVALIG